MADQRNFRSAYLEKVGIKGVEEVKAIEILLREQPLDRSKLVQFCQRYPVPATYRPYLWKVLLGEFAFNIAHVNRELSKSCQKFYSAAWHIVLTHDISFVVCSWGFNCLSVLMHMWAVNYLSYVHIRCEATPIIDATAWSRASNIAEMLTLGVISP